MTADKNETREKEIGIRELLSLTSKWFLYFLSQWKIFVLAGLIGGIGGYFFAFTKKVQYEANLSFAMEDEKGGGGISGALGLASQFGFDLGGGGGGAFTGNNLIGLMRSRYLIERALLTTITGDNGKPVTLADYYLSFSKPEPVLDNRTQKPITFTGIADRAQFTRQQDSLLGNITNQISNKNLVIAQKDKKVSIYDVTVISRNEKFSKWFTESLVSEVSDFYINTKSKKSRLNVDILQRQADSIRAELNSAITGVASANDNTFNLNPALNIKRTSSTRRQIDVQANTAILTELVKNLEISKIALRKETPLLQVIDSPIFPLNKLKPSKVMHAILFSLGVVLLVAIFLGVRKYTSEEKIS